MLTRSGLVNEIGTVWQSSNPRLAADFGHVVRLFVKVANGVAKSPTCEMALTVKDDESLARFRVVSCGGRGLAFGARDCAAGHKKQQSD